MTAAVHEAASDTDPRVRVLLADDDTELRMLMRLTLEQQGFTVVGEAANGAEAVVLAEAYQPDVLLLDVAMPVMDGLQALRELRMGTPQLPVVMHSGFTESSLGEQCLSAGAVAYTEKGMDPARLARVLREAAAGVSTTTPPSSRPAAHPVHRSWPSTGGGLMPSLPSLRSVPDKAFLLAVVAFFAAIFSMRLLIWPDDDVGAVQVLQVVPISLLAARFGVRGGLAGTLVATVLLEVAGVAVDSQMGVVGFASRLVAFLVAGLAVGVFADRVERLRADERRASAAILSTNRQLAQALAQARSTVTDLESANDDLRQFGYIVSHDLAEPLRSMSGFSSLLASDYADRLDERGLQYLGFITDGAVRMRALIDDLRAYTLAGQQDLKHQPVALADVLSDVVEGLSTVIAEHSAVVEGRDLPVVVGDRPLLALVIQNLVSNGIKFNRSDQPRVTLTGRAAEDAMVAVDVTDNGIGIPAEHADRVFGLFARLHLREEYPGTGLGLAIVRRVVERHRGRVAIIASASGTTFRLTLPAAPGPDRGDGL